MKTVILINGYGVPDDIMTDRSYQSYLGQILNYLWDRYRTKQLTIIVAGGHTDMRPPYRRTEAGEMKKWFTPRIKELGLSNQWSLRAITSGLNALDNLLAAKRMVGRNYLVYFCEKTRKQKSMVLVKELFAARATVVPIDFDTSKPRYDTITRTSLEREDLKYCLRALRDARWRKKLHETNKMKINALRAVPAQVRAQEIDRITRQLRKDFLEDKR